MIPPCRQKSTENKNPFEVRRNITTDGFVPTHLSSVETVDTIHNLTVLIPKNWREGSFHLGVFPDQQTIYHFEANMVRDFHFPQNEKDLGKAKTTVHCIVRSDSSMKVVNFIIKLRVRL